MRLFAYRIAENLHYANVDVMLGEMEPHHLLEWAALQKINKEDRLQAEAAARATAGVENYRRRGR
jgi:hypothetical protein